jgi:hypothetical protein
VDKNEILQQIQDLFPGLPGVYGTYDITSTRNGLKKVGQAKTVRKTDIKAAWERHLSGQTTLGVPPLMRDGTVRFGAIDVDQYRDFNIYELEERIRGLGLPLMVCRSKSGGAHLYLFTSEPVLASQVQETLMGWAGVLGHANSEIFPKQVSLANDSDVGNWINMPYFGAKQTERFAVYQGDRLKLREFLTLADSMRVSSEDLDRFELTIHVPELDGAPPCLQLLVKQGFPEGTRNNGLFSLGVYSRLRFGDEWPEHLDDYNQKFMSPPLASPEVVEITKGLKRKAYFYKCKDQPLVGFCNKALCRQQKYGIGEGEPIAPDVTLDSLSKLMTDPPRWIVGVNGFRIEMDTAELLNQDAFRRKCVEALNYLPRLRKRLEFDTMIRAAMESVEEIPAPEDASMFGQFKHYFAEFLTRPRAKTRDELKLGKPFAEDGRVYFRAPDLMKFLQQERFQIREREVYSLFRNHLGGVKHHTLHIKGACVQCWSVPEEKLQSEEFDVAGETSGEGDLVLDF